MSLDGSYGVTPWLAVEARLVLRVVDTTPTYFEQDGTAKLVPNDIHHHDETLVGPGDPWLSVRLGSTFGKLTTAARFGLSLPLGTTSPDPYALGAQGKWHEHSQLGTGTVLPIVGLGLSYDTGLFDLSLSAMGLFSLYENEHGYRAPARYFVGFRAGLPLLDRRLTPFATLDMAHETDEIWHGAIGDEGSTRRTDLLVGAGLSFEFVRDWSLEASARGRVLKLSDAPGFDSPGVVQLALSTHFDGLRPK